MLKHSTTRSNAYVQRWRGTPEGAGARLGLRTCLLAVRNARPGRWPRTVGASSHQDDSRPSTAASANGFLEAEAQADGRVAASAVPSSLTFGDDGGGLTTADEASSPQLRIPRPPAQLQPGTVLAGKYTIRGVLGTGGSAVTYAATTADGGERVAIKALSLRTARDWKALTQFQREAQTLAALSHPGIPRYLDYFEEDTEDDREFFIVQADAGGKSLAQLLREGGRCTTQEATRIATELCEVLAYLADLHPPVVHRDIKPENIVLEGGGWGGRVYLVDFGGVAGVAAADSSGDASGGSFATATIVGTYGYMAPEQFRGAAQPASDMYGLGGTLLFLLSGQPPSAFPQERMRIKWWGGSRDGRAGGAAGTGGPSFSPPSPMWAALLDGLLEPVAEDRLTPTEALDLLLQGRSSSKVGKMSGAGQGGPAASSAAYVDAWAGAPLTPEAARLMAAQRLTAAPLPLARAPERPVGTRVLLDRSPGRLDVTIPPKGLMSSDTLMTGGFAIAWNAFVAVWTAGALAGGGIVFALFSLPFWFAGVQLGKQAVASALLRERLAIGRNRFRLGQELPFFNSDGDSGDDSATPSSSGGSTGQRVVEGRSADLLGARLVTTMFVNDQPQTAVELVEGVRKHRFGEGLELEEQRWLVGAVNEHLAALRGGDLDLAALPPPDMPKLVRQSRSRGPSSDGSMDDEINDLRPR